MPSPDDDTRRRLIIPSLNLAQAVMVVAYELRLALDAAADAPAAVRRTCARGGPLSKCLSAWPQALEAIGFVSPESAGHIMLTLRAMLGRGGLRPRELDILNGMARQIGWFAEGGREVIEGKAVSRRAHSLAASDQASGTRCRRRSCYKRRARLVRRLSGAKFRWPKLSRFANFRRPAAVPSGAMPTISSLEQAVQLMRDESRRRRRSRSRDAPQRIRPNLLDRIEQSHGDGALRHADDRRG